MTATATLALIAWLGLFVLFVGSKAYPLHAFRVGWIMLLANAVYETVERRLGVPRHALDIAVFLATVALGLLAGGPALALATAVVCGLAWVQAQRVELRLRLDVPATQHAEYAGRVPLPVPRLIVSVRGPVLHRGSAVYDLGAWPEGLEQVFVVHLLNPTTVCPQLPLSVRVAATAEGLTCELSGAPETCPEPGCAATFQMVVRAGVPTTGGAVRLTVTHGDWAWERTLRVSRVVPRAEAVVKGAVITRWKYGCSAGFCWRGDHDLYDPSTFQSADGLRIALGLAARYRMPTTVMLSARLSLEEHEHRAFCQHHGWDRRSHEIPAFVGFLRDEVDMANEQEFPTDWSRPLAAEIGNHMYLHYGTHAAADPGNGWTSHARMGDGVYPWMTGPPGSSLEEQRDNILRCTESFQQHLGVTPTSFTIPSDVYDQATSAAVEAAGIEVGNDTDTNKIQKLLLFPAERHPQGTQRLAELTRMLPRDPENAAQLAMLKFWVAFARRNRRALVYLAHHHLVMYQGNACYTLTSELLRYVLEATEGDVYAATMTALGRYWRDVLSERTKAVQVEWSAGTVTVTSAADRALHGLPVEVELTSGERFMWLADVASASTVRLVCGVST